MKSSHSHSRCFPNNVHRFRRAQVSWQQIGLEARIEILQQWKQAILLGREQLLAALVSDTGRLSTSILEIDSFVASIDRWCDLAPQLLQEHS